MNTLDIAWRAVERRATKARRRQIEPLRAFLRTIDNPHARVLSGLPAALPRDEPSAHALEALIVGQYRNNRISKLETAGWLGLTHAAIVELSARGQKLHQTRLAAIVAPEQSPFASNAVRAAERVDGWRDALHAWLRQDNAEVPRIAWHVAIVLSSVLHGALLDTTKLKRLVDCLRRDEVPDTVHACSTYSFDLPYQGLGNHHLQRWVLDPITEMLVWRTPDAGSSLDTSGLIKAIEDLLIACGVKASDCPNSLRDLVQSTTTWWSERGVQLEIQASTRRFTTHAFHPRSWARINGLDYAPRAARFADDDARPSEADLDSSLDDLPILFPWIEDAADVLAKEDLGSARIACAELLSAQAKDSIALTYLGWLDSMLSGQSATREALTLAKIRQRFDVTAPRLLAMLGDDDPAKLDTPTLEDYYAEMTSDADPAIPIRDLANGLRDFHIYLVRRFKKAHISKESEVLGDEASLLPVDANLPTYDEYLAAQAWLDKQLANGWKEEDISVCKLVMMLAFKSGMRRMEIFGLRLEDIHTHKRLIALLRPHAKRRLKTSNSRRTVPLFALLSLQEQRFLRDWITRRKKEQRFDLSDAGQTRFLFPEFDADNMLSWVDRMCDRICQAIRAVTNDRKLFLHHFRHAFGTWTYLRLRAPDLPMLARHFEKMPATVKMLQSGRRLRILLLERAAAPTRAYAFAVARLLGHSSPAVSMGHYIHASDLVLGAIAWRECADIPAPVLVAVSGLSTSAAYANFENGLHALVAASRDKFAKPSGTKASGQLQSTAAPRGRPKQAPPHLERAWVSFETLFRVLTLACRAGKDAVYIASDLGLEVSTIYSIISAATCWGPLIGLKVEDGKLVEIPAKPRGASQVEFMENMEIRFAEMAKRAPDLFAEGLELHLLHFNRQKCDVVFKGKKELPQLKRYLKFLESLGLESKDFQWVVRLPPDGTVALPAWCSKLNAQWLPVNTKRIGPPNLKKASSYAEWAGLQAVDSSGIAVGTLMSTAMFLACMTNRRNEHDPHVTDVPTDETPPVHR
jgi:integrase